MTKKRNAIHIEKIHTAKGYGVTLSLPGFSVSAHLDDVAVERLISSLYIEMKEEMIKIIARTKKDLEPY